MDNSCPGCNIQLLIRSLRLSVTCFSIFHFNPEKANLNATVYKFIGYLNQVPIDVDSALKLFAETATAMPPGAPAVTGKEGNDTLIGPVQS